MHIAYITSEFVTEKESGGLGTYLDNISNIMSKNGHKVTIITLSDIEGKLLYNRDIEVIRVKRTPLDSFSEVNRVVNMLENSWKLYRALNKVQRDAGLDIVQSANYQAVGFFKSCRLPTVVRASSDSSLLRHAAAASFDYETALKQKNLEDTLELMCVRRADAAYAPSLFCAKVVAKRAGRKLDIIESPFAESSLELDDSLYKNHLEGKMYLLFNSSLSSLKGTHLGIEATETILTRYPQLHLVYVGNDGGIRQSGEGCQSIAGILRHQGSRYDGRVIYLGKIEHKRLFPLIQNSLACVLPSRVDNLPNACIEAMAQGKIVIGTYGASFEQLIKNKQNGLLIQRDSVKSLVKAVDYLMGISGQQRIAMEGKAKETVTRLRPEAIYSQLIRYYQKVIDNFNKRGHKLK